MIRETCEGGFMRSYEYYKPATVEEAITSWMAHGDRASISAGGTDVLVLIRQRKLAPGASSLCGTLTCSMYLETKDGLKIGSAVTHNAIAKNEFIQKRYSALTDATCKIGSLQIRNVATMGGNICNAAPSADTACPLLVLDAKLSSPERTVNGKCPSMISSRDPIRLPLKKVRL